MGVALEAGYDLGVLASLLVCLGLLYAAKFIFGGLASALDFEIHIGPVHIRPLHWLASGLENFMISPIKDGIHAVEGAVAQFYHGLVTSLEILVALPILLGKGIADAFTKLWDHALKPFVLTLIHPLVAAGTKALALVTSLEATVANDLSSAERYAEGQATKAFTDAKAYTEHIFGVAEHDIASAGKEYLRGLETAAGTIAHDLPEWEHKTWDELKKLLDGRDLATLGGLVGGLALLRSMTGTLATEAGLDNANCRGKVKDICGTNGNLWKDLLGALVVTEVGLHWRSMIRLVGEGANIALEAAGSIAR